MKKSAIYFILLIAAISPFRLSGTIIQIPADYNTIQSGIIESVNGDTVLVAQGIYYENLTLSGKNILLCSDYIFSGNNESINNTIIDGNGNGRVITIENGEDSTCRIIGFTITNGFAQGYGSISGSGGGIMVNVSSPKISFCNITDNEAEYEGGGMYIKGNESWSGSNNHTKVMNCNISNNLAGPRGGGVRLINCSIDCQVINCNISHNVSDRGSGANIFHRGSLINCLVSHNTASVSAGGIYIDWGTFFGDQGVFIIGCTIVNNNGTDHGGTDYVINGGEFKNCILWGNTDSDGNISNHNGSSYEYTCSTPIPSGTGNIGENPEFLDLATENYSLSMSSPCKDAGNNAYNTLTFDLSGNQRIINDTIDLGCYETPVGYITDFNSIMTYACVNDNILFEPDTTNTSPDSLLWLFPGGSPGTSTALFPTVAYDREGSYDVTLTSWKNNLEYVITKEAYLHVFVVPVQPDVPSGPETVCFNAPISTYLTTNTSSIWDIEPANAGTISYTDSTCDVVWNEAFSGEAGLRVKIFNGCGEGEYSNPLVIQRMEPSGVDFSASQTLLVEKPYTIAFTNFTPDLDNYTFLWDFGNGETSTLAEPEYTYPKSGEYSVTLTATHQTEGCVDSIYKEEYIFCSGVGINSFDQKGFSCHVDHKIQVLTINFSQHPGHAKMIIFDVQGRICSEAEINSIKTSISVGNFNPGCYIFSIFGAKNHYTGKFIYNK